MSQQPATTPAKPRISARIGAIAESATLAVDAKAKALKAAGRPVIGFGAGEPDFPTPDYVVAAAVAACSVPANHRYTPAAGLPDLRQAIADKTLRDSGYQVTPPQVLVTNGGKQAVYQAFATVVDVGDEVLLPAPYWTTYPEAIRLAGGVPVEVFAGADQGYLVTVDQLEAARTEKTKALLFCSPSNPTGAVYSPEQTEAIGRWALEHGIWVITDEIYEHLTYDDAVFTPIVRAVPELADTAIVLNGVAKTYAMTGWRVGWMIGPTDVIKAATNLQSHLSSNVANVSQRAAIAAVSGDLSAVAMMREAFDRRRRTIVSMLSAIDGVVCPTPKGAFYAYPSVRGRAGQDHPRGHADHVGRAGCADPRPGRGGRGARRGLRAERLPAAELRAGRRRPGRGRGPDRRAAGRGSLSPRRRPAMTPAGLLLTPGSGGDPDHPALVAVAGAVKRRRRPRARRFGFGSPDGAVAGRHPRAPRWPGSAPRPTAGPPSWASTPARLVLGGRSFGGRMCSVAVAEGQPAAGLVLLSYPLHPPGRPERLRVEHLPGWSACRCSPSPAPPTRSGRRTSSPSTWPPCAGRSRAHRGRAARAARRDPGRHGRCQRWITGLTGPDDLHFWSGSGVSSRQIPTRSGGLVLAAGQVATRMCSAPVPARRARCAQADRARCVGARWRGGPR